ncbi:hypothetical protein D3C74_503080 [compost metagenome]
MPLEYLLCFASQRFYRFTDELLSCRSNVFYSASNLDNSYTVSNNRNPLLRVHFRCGDIELV